MCDRGPPDFHDSPVTSPRLPRHVGVIYIIFNVIYTFSADDIVYDILDWVDHARAAAFYCTSLLLVLAPLIWLCMYGLYRIRLAIFNRCFHGRGHASYASFES